MPHANAIKYASGTGKNWSQMTTDGAAMHDNSVNDTATYDNATGTGTSGGMTAIIDLGSDQNVDEAKFTTWSNGDSSDTWQLQRASDASGGSTWTNVQGALPITTNPTSFDQTFTSVAARYWRLVITAHNLDNLSAWETRIYDFRLYVGGAEYTYDPTQPPGRRRMAVTFLD